MRFETKGFQCEVVVDHRPLNEYKMEITGNTATCWIAAEEGKIYEVVVTSDTKPLKRLETFVARLYIDGEDTKVCGHCLDHFDKAVLAGRRTRGNALQRLAFNRLLWKVKGDQKVLSGDPKQFSSVRVEIVKAREGDARWDTGERVSAISTPTTVDEKSVKQCGRIGGIDTNTILCPVPSTGGYSKGTQRVVDVTDIDDICTFIFKYGSRELLEAQSIIPAAKPAYAETDPDDFKGKGKRRFMGTGDDEEAEELQPEATRTQSPSVPRFSGQALSSPKKRTKLFDGIGLFKGSDDGDEGEDGSVKPRKIRFSKEDDEEPDMVDE
ncbi:hypothetical protein HDV00_003870 [Rhizophlyctis rosea]|nr:hypothetical protein HDV00_003870 [Rhizophlyctis rosea]